MKRRPRSAALSVGAAAACALAIAAAVVGGACGLEAAGLDGGAPGEDVHAPDVVADTGVADTDVVPDVVDAAPDVMKPPCPTGRGPRMVQVPGDAGIDAGGTFCVDGTEVTNADYQLFLAAVAADAGVPALPAACTGHTTHTPSITGAPAVPVGGVDWCDAYVYCAWAGKRLCAPARWLAVCTRGGTRPLPYGDAAVAGACNVGTGAVADAGSHPACEGGFAGVFDMVGNAWEWADECAADAGLTDLCTFRGGSYFDPQGTTCGATLSTFTRREKSLANVGFRCCADAQQ